MCGIRNKITIINNPFIFSQQWCNFRKHCKTAYDTLLGRGKEKKYFYLHFVDKRFTPPPLFHVGGIYNNFITFDYYPHRLIPPPLSTFRIFYNIFEKGIFNFFFCFG